MAPKILKERGSNPLSLMAIFHPLLKIKRKKKPLTQLYSANPNTPADIINLLKQRKLTREHWCLFNPTAGPCRGACAQQHSIRAAWEAGTAHRAGSCGFLLKKSSAKPRLPRLPTNGKTSLTKNLFNIDHHNGLMTKYLKP